MFRFECKSCGEWHEGMPSFGAEAPVYYYGVPENERTTRCKLASDTCIIDGEHFFVRGRLDIPVEGKQQPFSWSVWVSLSKANFGAFEDCYDLSQRSHIGPFFGWLSVELMPLYPSTVILKASVRLCDNGVRPMIEAGADGSPVGDRAAHGNIGRPRCEIYAFHMHPPSGV